MAPVLHDRAELTALNADVVGYSRLVAEYGDQTAGTMRRYHALVSDGVSAGGGTLTSFVGDNFMAVFGDPMHAMQTAIAITRDVETHNATVPKPMQVRFRMGLDLGELETVGGDYQGDALNVAARIQSLAVPGGISVSGRVYQGLDEPALRFRPAGRRTLKNIPEPVEVYDLADLPSDGAGPARRSSLSLEIPTLAVLPILTELVDDTVKAGANIVRADLVHRLAAIPELEIIDARESPGSAPVRSTARYMLETGAHQVASTVRIFATLFDVTTMNIVKSHKWTGSVEELVDRSLEMADEVARSVEVELVVGAPAGLYADLEDPAAIEQVYLGWYNLRSGTREAWTRAIDLFGRVAVAHPDQPYGHVLSAFANWIGADNEWVPDSGATLRLAREQAHRGIEIGDPTGMAKAVDAAILMSMGEVDRAMETMEEVEILRPTCDVTYGLEGSIRRYMGEWEQAVDLLDVAMRLTGINKPWYPTVKACSLFVGHRLEQAASVAESVLEYQPKNLEALLVLAAAQRELGMERRARATADLVRERFPAVDVAGWIDRNPYQDPTMVDRWKADLVEVGLIPGS